MISNLIYRPILLKYTFSVVRSVSAEIYTIFNFSMEVPSKPQEYLVFSI